MRVFAGAGGSSHENWISRVPSWKGVYRILSYAMSQLLMSKYSRYFESGRSPTELTAFISPNGVNLRLSSPSSIGIPERESRRVT